MTDYQRLLKESKEGKIVTIVDNDGKEKKIGFIHDRKFIKVVRKSKHFLHTPPAIGIDQYIFQTHIADECDIIVILDREEKAVYTTSVEAFGRYAMTLDRGFGTQRALTMNHWAKNMGVEQQRKLL